MLNKTDFVLGILFGFVVLGIIGYVSSRIQWARGQMQASRRPQTVSQQTNQTPAEVVRTSIAAGFSYLIWNIVRIVIFVAIAYVLFFIFSDRYP